MMNKRKSHAFGKDIYLVGKESDGTLVWLKSPEWDCGWYWGFGYMESYTNNKNPSAARDISSHSHWSGFVGNIGGKWYHHINESPALSETVLTESESWELSDLMQSFYTLKETAEIYGRGNSHLTSAVKVDLTNESLVKQINEVDMPRIFARVIEILSPEN